MDNQTQSRAMGAAAERSYQRRQPENTVLYETIAAHAETFIAERETEGNPLPTRVIKEIRSYLRCGILQYGFVRTVCSSCDFERAVAFSCKGRGFCPSCAGRRSAEAVLHLIDHILPHAAYRQWVITFPHALRYWLARDNKLVSRVNKIATACIGKHLANKAISNGVTTPLPGMITFIQHAGSALSANLHLHILAIDGVYAAPASLDARPRLHPLSGPSDDEVAQVVAAIARRTIRHLQRRGLLDAEGEVVSRPGGDELVGGDRAMSMATQASVFNKIAFLDRGQVAWCARLARASATEKRSPWRGGGSAHRSTASTSTPPPTSVPSPEIALKTSSPT